MFDGLIDRHSRLGLYTNETKDSIPATPGCYAWFLPLWLYTDDLDDLVQMVARILRFEPAPTKQATLRFARDHVEVSVTKTIDTTVSAVQRQSWNALLQHDASRAALEEILLEASLLMPPLYVGRTSNLQRRYAQHTSGQKGKNDFYRRFTTYVRDRDLKLLVSDLLFACVRTADIDPAKVHLTSKAVETLIEHVLIRLGRPSFSLRG